MKILITPTSFRPDVKSDALEKLSSFSSDLVFNPTGKPLDENALIELLQDCDGYLAGLDTVSENVLKNCPHLKAISRYGAGYDRVDIAAAKKLGIPVSNTPGANAEAVAELAFAHVLALARNITYLNEQTKSGKWVRANGMELAGKTIGIIGLGAIGKIVARCATGFQMSVQAYDPFIQTDYCQEHDIHSVSLEDLLTTSDVITLHLPLNDETYHMINKNALHMIKKGSIIVNASRGGIIDETAAYEALTNGTLGGLGLDAFEKEPPKDSPLFSLNNVILTPHTGAHTTEAKQSMAVMAAENLIDMLSGKECRYIVNK